MFKKVLVINLGWENEPMIKNLFNRGYEVYGIHDSKEYVKFDYKDVLISPFDNLTTIVKFCEGKSFDAILSDQCDFSNYTQSYLTTKLQLPSHGLKASEISKNKESQRKIAFSNDQIKVPIFKVCKTIDDIEEMHKHFPIIIKPVDNRGSIGISVANSEKDLEFSFKLAINNSKSKTVIAEQFINGTEFTVDGYCFNGVPKSLAIAKKLKIGVDSQVSTDIEYPAKITESLYKELLITNERVSNAFNYNFGFTHSEYIVDKTGDIYLVESANRGGGVFTSEIILPIVTDLDLLNKYIDDCLDISNDINVDPNRNQIILKFLNFPVGKNFKTPNLDEFKNKENIIKLKINLKNNEEVKKVNNDAQRHGFLIYSSNGNIRKEVNQIINQLYK